MFFTVMIFYTVFRANLMTVMKLWLMSSVPYLYCILYFVMQVVLKEDGKSMVVSDDDIRGNLKVSNAWIFNINIYV